jgi:hypothetical protein
LVPRDLPAGCARTGVASEAKAVAVAVAWTNWRRVEALAPSAGESFMDFDR